MVCISYVGEEAYDVILYMGRTLTKLNYRVLIIDLSETKALFNAINHGMGLDSNQDIVNYRDINYTQRLPSKEELAVFQSGVIYVSYGNNYRSEVILPCEEFNVVINSFPHTIEKINLLMGSAKCESENINLLIRDIVSIDDVDRVKSAVNFPFQNHKGEYLYLDASDYECAVNCQVKQIVKFSNISSHMKKYIILHIHRLFPDLKESRIKKALKAAGRGK
jgi:hypothetical protein